MSEAKIRRDNIERYEEGFRKKFRLLSKSCAAFDAGDIDEADRIATEIVSFCHSGSAQSILSALNYSKKEIYLDTSGDEPQSNLMSDWLPLVIMEIGGEFTYKPQLSESSKRNFLKLNRWWAGVVLKQFFHQLNFEESLGEFDEKVIKNMLFHSHGKKKNDILTEIRERRIYPHLSFSRRNLILDIRNTEASHFDKAMSESTVQFGRKEFQSFIAFNGNEEMLPRITILNATIRQIGYELLESLKNNFPELCNVKENT
ncbi:hypothetical protein N9W89_07155 [Hellea sp.]|nr:hypothetical protein [Hellea sp.]